MPARPRYEENLVFICQTLGSAAMAWLGDKVNACVRPGEKFSRRLALIALTILYRCRSVDAAQYLRILGGLVQTVVTQ